MKIYTSKIGYLVILIFIFFIGFTLFSIVLKGFVWTIFLVNSFVLMFLFNITFSIKYIINDKILIIKGGLLYRMKIDISSIKKIEESRSLLSSPAPSLDRLEIIYNKYDSILISPKEKEDFINEILKINPDVRVVYRKK